MSEPSADDVVRAREVVMDAPKYDNAVGDLLSQGMREDLIARIARALHERGEQARTERNDLYAEKVDALLAENQRLREENGKLYSDQRAAVNALARAQAERDERERLHHAQVKARGEDIDWWKAEYDKAQAEVREATSKMFRKFREAFPETLADSTMESAIHRVKARIQALERLLEDCRAYVEADLDTSQPLNSSRPLLDRIVRELEARGQ